jgi:predicted ATPase
VQPQADQGRLFTPVRRLLDRLATEPTLLVLEDLHWADASTRALLAYLVHGLGSGNAARLLLVGTYRSDEMSRRHPLRSLLAELHPPGCRAAAT